MVEKNKVNNDNESKKEEKDMENRSMEELLDQYKLKDIQLNQVVEGEVIRIGNDEVIVDIDYKQEGFIQKEECINYKGELSVSKGSYVKAVVEKISSKGVMLSKSEYDKIEGWKKVERSYETDTPIIAPLVKKVNKGFLADIGVDLFLPDSHLDIKPVKSKSDYLGKEYRFKILNIDPKRKSAVISRKAILIEERKQKKAKLFSSLNVGDEINAEIIKIRRQGAIALIDSLLTAFVPKSEISWGYLPNIRKKLKVGKNYKFKILEVDKSRKRIILSYKAFKEDPWKNLKKKFKIGDQVTGMVIGFKRNYALVEIEEGVTARLSGDDVYWGKRVKNLKYVFKIGDKVIAKILDIIPEKKLIFIGLKQLEPSPWEKFVSKYKEGNIVDVKVKKLANSGVIVNIMPDVDGFIRKGDLSWGFVEHPSEEVKEGDKLQALILSIEEDTYRILLGVKQIEGDKWKEFFSKYKTGDIIDTKVKKIKDKFVVLEFLNGLEGIVRINEIAPQKVEKIEDFVKVGEKKEALIIKTDKEKRKILLSFKKLEQAKQKKEIEKIKKDESKSKKTTIGDLIKKEIMNKNNDKE